MTTFTVVIATRNRADLLPRAVRSVLEQSMADLEVIVSDDGSTDDTRAVVEGIDDDRLRYVSGDSGGPSAARNRGAAHAVGDFIAFLDDDDEASPGWLEAFLAPLAAERCAAVCCGAEKLLPDGSRTVELPRDLGPAFGDRTGLFLCGTFALRRSAFDELGGYTESLRWSEQTDLALRLCTRADELGWDIACVQAPLITYHQALPLERSSKVPREMARAAHHLLREHANELSRDPQRRADYLSVAAVAEARLGELADARRDFWRAWRARPTDPKNLARMLASTSKTVSGRLWS
jgi:glycosyltransferase involved in cell wall biosynthesis